VADKFVIQHGHCGVCGACLLQRDQLHKCPGAEPMRPDILEVFLEETNKYQRVSTTKRTFSVDASHVEDGGKQTIPVLH
jgi:hypothetical protein